MFIGDSKYCLKIMNIILCHIYDIWGLFCLQTLPELSRVPGLVLPGSAFSDCLMLVQFLCSFGKVLGLDKDLTMLNLCDLQVGLLNIGDRMGKLQDLLVSMLSAAVCDPGIPTGHKVRFCLFSMFFLG